MKVVILNAGIGFRLGRLTKDKPKCLLKVCKNKTILDLQLEFLKSNNFEYKDVYIVAGHKIERLFYFKNKGINIIFNPKYKEYNNIYSFYLAKKYINEDFILINGDVIFHPFILKNLLFKQNGTYFVVDNTKKLGEEEMKVIIRSEKIVQFGKEINPEIASGEYIGIARININDAKIIFDKMEKLIKKGKTDIWYENAINHVLPKVVIKPLYTRGLPWIEVDTPKDYEKAKEIAAKIIKSSNNLNL